MIKKDCIAMILAGGQGSRLGALTYDIAKPAVIFGGKYRIIDFTLSNCAHSGIDTVGVLTQYQPLELNTYIGNGQPWDLNRNNGGVYVLPPYTSAQSGEWYKGTANAIFQNIEFIDKFNPDNVVILSGDHIYKMHYMDMVRKHEANGADCTIAVIEVPWEEASRFGVMSCDDNGRITEFAEKPKEPKSNLASMGVYVFKWSKLRQYLIEDEADTDSSNDFGKNIIPKMLGCGEKLSVYKYTGYWKDVGTIYSLWEANMDLIADPPICDINDRNWRIFSRNKALPPQYLGEGSNVVNSAITEGCSIYGTVKNSVLSSKVVIEKGATVIDSIIMDNVRIKSGAVVEKSIIASGSQIGEGAHIGADDGIDEFVSPLCSNDICLIGENVNISQNVKISKNSMIEKDI